MKIYELGKDNAPTLMLLPGTFCDWKGNFENVLHLLEKDFKILCVSYTGFEKTEKDNFISMTDEVEKIEKYILNNYGGHIHAAYGCSLGGSFVGLLISRGNIKLDIGILGSSDLDQSNFIVAWIKTLIMTSIIYPVVKTGKVNGRILKFLMRNTSPESVDILLKIIGGARSYVTKQSCKRQYYSDLVTLLPSKIDSINTEIHIFYALNMGKKYLGRYKKYFANPIIHEHQYNHEELLALHPIEWTNLVKRICL